MVGAAYKQEARNAADSAGKEHCADNDFFNVDAYVSCGIFAFAHDLDFISVLAVTKIDENRGGEHSNNYDIDEIIVPADGGEPSGLGGAVDNTDLTGALWHGPDVCEERNYLNGNVVHHKGEQRFVGVPFCAEHRRDKSPNCARHDGSNNHNGEEQQGGQLIAEKNHAACGGKSTDKHLTLRAGVPKAHFKSGRYRKGDAEQNCYILEKRPNAARSSKGTVDHSCINAQGVFAGEQNGDKCAYKQCSRNRTDSDKPRFPPHHGGTLYNMEQGLVLCLFLIIHLLHLCLI